MERRREHRDSNNLKSSPVWCSLSRGVGDVRLEVINFHFNGACLKTSNAELPTPSADDVLVFNIGTEASIERISFRVIWETIAINGCFGVEFTTAHAFAANRPTRFGTSAYSAPTIIANDPLDPNRSVYFKVENVSMTGLFLSTSFANRHILPGMELRDATIEIPGSGKTQVDLFIENSRRLADGVGVGFGVSVRSSGDQYMSLISAYVSAFASAPKETDRLETLANENMLFKNIREHLTLREIETESDYQTLLKLRHLAFQAVGKTGEGSTVASMGPGREKEGVIIGAYLRGQLVASMEVRIVNIHGASTTVGLPLSEIKNLDLTNLAEVNRLVVHPRLHRSDVVLGMFQKLHTLLILSGKPDTLVYADSRLVKLYRRIGARRTSISKPHPVKKGETLTLMMCKGETYASAKGMNPYAWEYAFGATQKYLASKGVVAEKKWSPSAKIVKVLTKTALRLKKKPVPQSKIQAPLKSHPKSELKSAPQKSARSKVIQPRYTKPHYHSSVFLPYLLEAKATIGVEATQRLLFTSGFDEAYFYSNSNWVSLEFFNKFISDYSKLGDTAKLHIGAGFRSISKEVQGVNYYVIKHFLTPTAAFKAMGYLLPKFNKTRVYRLIDSSSTHVRFRLDTPERNLLPEDPAAEHTWVSVIDAYVRLITGQPATIKTLKSSFHGDDYCEYLVSWRNPTFSTKNIAAVASVAALFLGLGKLGASTNLAGLSVVTTVLGGLAYSFRKRYVDMVGALTKFEKDADDKYRELQNSKVIVEQGYQEGKVLEKIASEIQSLDDVSAMLDSSLQALCSGFGFKRAFLMLVDDHAKILQTSSVVGPPEDVSRLWGFKVDVSLKRDNPALLSSVYHSGQSVLIADADEHKFQLNDRSRQLVDALSTPSFALVPIPSALKNWGVLIADKGRDGGVVNRRDLVAIQRVAQSLGIALDKKAKMDQEIKIRKIFQRYVPITVIEQTLGASEPSLIGESKNVVCLFMDIRNFTSLSEELPPQILCEILNQVFDGLYRAVTENGGTIDKFLGDGALVTWGAVPGSVADANSAVRAARALIENVRELSEKLVLKGMREIGLGIGIDQGMVVAGNIGTQNRLEYTVIGTTVNRAARLEQLTKMMKTQIVVSDDVFQALEEKGCWTFHEKVQIRGLENPINVAALNSDSEKREAA